MDARGGNPDQPIDKTRNEVKGGGCAQWGPLWQDRANQAHAPQEGSKRRRNNHHSPQARRPATFYHGELAEGQGAEEKEQERTNQQLLSDLTQQVPPMIGRASTNQDRKTGSLTEFTPLSLPKPSNIVQEKGNAAYQGQRKGGRVHAAPSILHRHRQEVV